MLVLFGFEREWYLARGVDAVHVGHPLIDQVPVLSQAWETQQEDPTLYRIALLPGSRKSEVTRLLPVMLQAAERLARRFPIELQVIKAPDLSDGLFEKALGDCSIRARVVRQDRSRAIGDSHLALCASGTATLEVGLLGTPMIVVYKVNLGSYWLGRLVIEVPHISLVNLVLRSAVVPEMVQSDADPQAIADQGAKLLSDRVARDEQRARLAELRTELGRSGGSERAATEVLAVIEVAA